LYIIAKQGVAWEIYWNILMKNASGVSFIVIWCLLVLCPFAARGTTFTLSDDALLLLDYKYVSSADDNAVILKTRDVNGHGVRFDILFPDPNKSRGQEPSLFWTSYIHGGDGTLTGRDINNFDTFALKFTYLSAAGVSVPDAVAPVAVSALINPHNGYDGYSFDSVGIYNNSPKFPASATSLAKTDANQIELVGFACYIPYWLYSSHNPWDANGATVRLLVGPAPDAVIFNPRLLVKRCSVAAGKTEVNDSIYFSGRIDSAAKNFIDANAVGAEVKVSLDSQDFNTIVWTFPVDANTWKRGIYKCSTTENASKTSFTVNTKTSKYSFSSKNLDLSGLSCPLTVRIKIGDYTFRAVADESVVNGLRKPIPLDLLMGVKNVLRVEQPYDKFELKRGKDPNKNTDRLSVKGGFAVEKPQDVNMAAGPLDVNLAGQTFTIPAGKFKPNKNNDRFTCSNVLLYDDPNLIGIASADFNFRTCTFSLSIKNAKITAGAGPADLRLQFPGFDEKSQILLP
jgi:hypothetical protein